MAMEDEKLAENLEKNNNEKENEDLKRKLKFLLRRIENNIEVEESTEEVYNLVESLKVKLEDILICVERDMIKKDEVLNSVAVKFYIKGYYDNVMPLFQAAYEYNHKNVDLIYNLAYFLYDLGERELALTYFEKIQGIDAEIDKFIMKLREGL
jgi:tetratricopeptide (TPR) repeat protein